jgi:hypothetical protein
VSTRPTWPVIDEVTERLERGGTLAVDELPSRVNETWRGALTTWPSEGSALGAGPSRLWREGNVIGAETRVILEAGECWANQYIVRQNMSRIITFPGDELALVYRMLSGGRPESVDLVEFVAPLLAVLVRHGAIAMYDDEVQIGTGMTEQGEPFSLVGFVRAQRGRDEIDAVFLLSLQQAVRATMRLLSEARALHQSVMAKSPAERDVLLSDDTAWRKLASVAPRVLSDAAGVAEKLADATWLMPLLRR